MMRLQREEPERGPSHNAVIICDLEDLFEGLSLRMDDVCRH